MDLLIMTAIIVNPLTNPKYENYMHLTVSSPHCYPTFVYAGELSFYLRAKNCCLIPGGATVSVDCGLIVLKKFNFASMFLGMREMDPDFPGVKPVLVDFTQPGEIIKAK